ncbi:hypothetical protein LEMLEM_LOCUS14097 [Lemmus lemmus]
MLMPPERTVQQALGVGSLDSWKRRASRDAVGDQESPRGWKTPYQALAVIFQEFSFLPLQSHSGKTEFQSRLPHPPLCGFWGQTQVFKLG